AFGERLDLIESARLVEAGFFGTGAPHPRLLDRIGDYCLIPRERGILVQRLPFEEGHRQIGVHGGLSPQELEVPLCELRAT
ncbi:MAG: phosphodiesterase, partial [Chromatiaceae bacterium]|nr:phosphodiesterase [Chromatiaceae bacterium]